MIWWLMVSHNNPALADRKRLRNSGLLLQLAIRKRLNALVRVRAIVRFRKRRTLVRELPNG